MISVTTANRIVNGALKLTFFSKALWILLLSILLQLSFAFAQSEDNPANKNAVAVIESIVDISRGNSTDKVLIWRNKEKIHATPNYKLFDGDTLLIMEGVDVVLSFVCDNNKNFEDFCTSIKIESSQPASRKNQTPLPPDWEPTIHAHTEIVIPALQVVLKRNSFCFKKHCKLPPEYNH